MNFGPTNSGPSNTASSVVIHYGEADVTGGASLGAAGTRVRKGTAAIDSLGDAVSIIVRQARAFGNIFGRAVLTADAGVYMPAFADISVSISVTAKAKPAAEIVASATLTAVGEIFLGVPAGSAPVSTSITMTANAGGIQRGGAADINAGVNILSSPDLQLSGEAWITRKANAAINASATLGAAEILRKRTFAVISALNTTVVADCFRTQRYLADTANIVGTGVLSESGYVKKLLNAAFDGTAALSATGKGTNKPTAAVTNNCVVTGVGKLVLQGTAAVTNTCNVTGVGASSKKGAGAVSGTATTVSSSIVYKKAFGDLSATALATSAGDVAKKAFGDVTNTVNIVAAGTSAKKGAGDITSVGLTLSAAASNRHITAPDFRTMVVSAEDRTMIVSEEIRLMEVA